MWQTGRRSGQEQSLWQAATGREPARLGLLGSRKGLFGYFAKESSA